MIDNLSIAVNAFTKRIITSLSVDETLLLRYVILSTILRGPLLRVEVTPSRLKLIYSVKANVSFCLLEDKQQGFGNLRSSLLFVNVAQGQMNGAPNETRTHSLTITPPEVPMFFFCIHAGKVDLQEVIHSLRLL